MLQQFGYYIVEKTVTPESSALPCQYQYSISRCIANHPVVEDKKLQKVMKNHYADNVHLDGRFQYLQDAKAVYQEFFQGNKECKIIGVSLENEYLPLLEQEMEETLLVAPTTFGTFLGYEILGWDHGSFHSYLCNGLDVELSREYPLQVSDNGFIQNTCLEVQQFTKYIQGKGEPVRWLPFALHDCTK